MMHWRLAGEPLIQEIERSMTWPTLLSVKHGTGFKTRRLAVSVGRIQTGVT
jgi:hypothetical protein